ncbi:hypothetical protein [Hymenobacter crusticola]|uniref:Outer membrane protein beta-barrel domain-containing protein n=1 Tax=Hymenobacter crusticola TaxID=1770526 RepID=A0A243WD66_9BACT|nr:hypothetical protein [Hymenobacter crusticola]OUJ73364.1 hypothetical protein BXP70_13185 [Hymenobacter crusticola]
MNHHLILTRFFRLLVALSLLLPLQSFAAASDSSATSKPGSIIRVDMLAACFWIPISTLNGGTTAPLLLSGEQFLNKRTSVGAELQWGKILSDQRQRGGSLQARYYFFDLLQSHHDALYVSPRLRYRAVRRETFDNGRIFTSSSQGGAELLIGWQIPLDDSLHHRMVLDPGLGVGYWFRLRPDRTSARQPEYFRDPIALEMLSTQNWQMALRIGLGYQF